MAIGSGIGAQLMIGAEATVGTAVTPTRTLEFNSETLKLSKQIVQGTGLRSVGLYDRAGRRNFTTKTAAGDINLDVATSGMGLLFKGMLGASASGLVSGTAFQQVHSVGSLVGSALTVQKGIPQTDGTVKPFTYNGCKVMSWDLACAVGGILNCRVGLDAWNEATATALATPVYAATSNIFHFAQGSLTLGGTVTTTAGVASVAGGTVAASIKGATVSGTNGLKTDRFFLGSAGIKAEQIENAMRGLTGTLDAEFVNQATIYDVFAADAASTLKLTFTGTTAISAGVFAVCEILIPHIRFDGESPTANNPDVVGLSAGFTGLDDGVNSPIQIRYVTTDTTVS